MPKSDNRKQQLKRFLQELGLPSGWLADWVRRLTERGVPLGAIIAAMEGKLLVNELWGLSQHRSLMSGLMVPFDRIENWLQFWQSPRHFWSTLFRGMSASEPSSETAEPGDPICLWDTVRVLRLVMRKAEMSAAMGVTFTDEQRRRMVRFWTRHWEEIRTAMIEQLRELHAEVSKPTAHVLPVEEPVNWVLFDAVRFLHQVWFPSLFEYQATPWQLLDRARQGDALASGHILNSYSISLEVRASLETRRFDSAMLNPTLSRRLGQGRCPC